MALESFDAPESSLIHRADYDTDSLVLTVELLIIGGVYKTYTTNGFPQSLWEEFATSPSKGAFFNKHIRTMYLLHPKD